MQIVRSCSGSTVVVVLLLLETINLNLMNTLTDLRWKIKDGLQPHLHVSLPVHQVTDMMDDQKPILGPTQLNPQITIGGANIKINPKELLGTHIFSYPSQAQSQSHSVTDQSRVQLRMCQIAFEK